MMLFNPYTMRLMTQDRKLIKQLSCPKNAQWNDMNTAGSTDSRECEHCSRRVHDIENMTDKEVLERVRENPATCLKLELNYDNIRVVTIDD